MKVVFLIDPLQSLHVEKDTSVELMREASSRGYRIFAVDVSTLEWDGSKVTAIFDEIKLQAPESTSWYKTVSTSQGGFAGFQAAIMRKDPPFDAEYLYATHLLDHVHKVTPVINLPEALRNYNEKLGLLYFPQFAPETIVTSSRETINQFIDTYGDVILKPLDSMGGFGIFRVTKHDHNRFALIDTSTDFGKKHVMAQKYLPEIEDGDKRIILIDGEPIPYVLARMPAKGETRANLAAGGRGVARALQEEERRIAESVGRVLKDKGLFLVGLDMIGNHLTEINVTSPTCFVEIRKQTGFSAAKQFWDKFEERFKC